MSKERKETRDTAAKAVEYAQAMHDALDGLSEIVGKFSDRGYLLSCRVSWGRVLSVGVQEPRGGVRPCEDRGAEE